MESRGRRVHSIEKAIRLLDCFWEADSPLSLHELEQRTGWAKSTIHGLLATMLDSAVVEQNPTDGKYRLGYHLFELGSAVRQGWSVPELCRPHLRAMAARIYEGDGPCRYAIGVICIAGTPAAEFASMRAAVMETAQNLSALLGHRAPGGI